MGPARTTHKSPRGSGEVREHLSLGREMITRKRSKRECNRTGEMSKYALGELLHQQKTCSGTRSGLHRGSRASAT